MRRGRWLLAAVALLASPGAARAAAFAPVDAPGPALSVPQAQLAGSLRCSAGVTRAATREPVLMVPGTTLDPSEFSWNWLRALAARGIPYCTVRLPGNAMGDIQVAAEHVVYALREMHRRTGRRVQVVGHSQGGMVPRFALRFWPDTRALVDDLVGLAPSNHGTLDAAAVCAAGCAPAIWQQRNGSAFLTALNSRQETFRGISYTVAYTRADEVVTPNLDARTGSSALRTGDGARSNVALQDVCPLDASEHIATGTYDAVAYAIAMDALTHPGPAVPARIGRGVCAQPFQPGVNPATFATDDAATLSVTARVLATYPRVAAEPPLRCYVTATCAKRRPAPAAGKPRRCRVAIRLPRRFTRARVRVRGHRVHVRRRHGRLVARVTVTARTVVRIRARTKRPRRAPHAPLPALRVARSASCACGASSSGRRRGTAP